MKRPPSDQCAWPPMEPMGSASNRITDRSADASSYAATRPDSPAPTTMTSVSIGRMLPPVRCFGVRSPNPFARCQRWRPVPPTTVGPMIEAAVVSPSDLMRLRGLLTATGPGMELISPVTGEVIGELPTSTAADVEVGAQIAHRAQQDWAARPIEERAEVLLHFHDHLLDQRDYFVDLLQAAGKDRLSAVLEVFHVALTARYYGRTARRYLRSERGEGVLPFLTRIERHYLPKGLVGVIGPWNYPLT